MERLPCYSRTAVLTVVALASCNGEAVPGSEWRAVRDTVADTVVIRTVSGSVWGEGARLVPEVSIGVVDRAEEYMFGEVRGIAVGPAGDVYIVDAQAPALRSTARTGRTERLLEGEERARVNTPTRMGGWPCCRTGASCSGTPETAASTSTLPTGLRWPRGPGRAI